jgi:hypothetical protein
MTKATRTTLSLVVALVVFGALAMAQAGGNTKNTDNKEHHSRLSKAAFWRHKDGDKNAKTKPTQASKQSHAKTAQLKPASAKVSAGKKDQKHAEPASKVSKPTAKKAPATSKTKSQPTA